MSREPEHISPIVRRVLADIAKNWERHHGKPVPAHARELIEHEKGADEMIRIREFAPDEIEDILKGWAIAGAAPVLVRGSDGRLVVRFGGISRVIASCLHPSRELWANVRYWLGTDESDAVVGRIVGYFFPHDRADYVRRTFGIIDALEISDAEIEIAVVGRVLRIEATAASLHQCEMKQA